MRGSEEWDASLAHRRSGRFEVVWNLYHLILTSPPFNDILVEAFKKDIITSFLLLGESTSCSHQWFLALSFPLVLLDRRRHLEPVTP